MSLEAMVSDLVAASERWARNNPQPPPREPPGPRIEDRIVLVHVTRPQPPPTRSPAR